MNYLAVYDIADPKRLRRVAQLMESYGYRVQRSVFECNLTPAALRTMKNELKAILLTTDDSVRLYPLFANALEKQTILGIGEPTPFPAETCVVCGS